ncbi:undecaprenyl-diphosphate phosphatase [bacterium]|nr:undecaprenyl-diphosphate phosphatase [bacterium]
MCDPHSVRPVIFAFILFHAAVIDAAAVDDSSTQPTEQSSQLTTRDALILGVVEGITEFLPISSTGHLIITNRALGLDAEEPMLDAEGNPIWVDPPSADDPAGRPLTLKLAADTYIVVIQVGAILAVVMVFWNSMMSIFHGLRGNDQSGLLLLRNIAVAFFPVVIVGLALDDWIDANLFSINTVIASLVVGALLMLGAEYWRKRRGVALDHPKTPAELSVRESLQVGAMQCLALWPGMSRSMVTMVGGYFSGLAPAKAAEFAFLVGVPVLGGAAVYKGLQTGPAMLALFGWSEMLIGGAAAALSAAIAVRFLVAWLQKFGLGAFAIYRLILAAVLAWWVLG